MLSGPGTVSGSTLTITGAGSIVVQASQAGNSSYLPATPVNVTVTVNPAALTVMANNQDVVQGATIPRATGTLTGVRSRRRHHGRLHDHGSDGLDGGNLSDHPGAERSQRQAGQLQRHDHEWIAGDLQHGVAAVAVDVSDKRDGGRRELYPDGGRSELYHEVGGAVERPARTTTYVSATQLTATILAADIAVAGTGLVTVANPAPNAGTSSALPFVVMSNTAVPTITGASLANGSGGSQVLVLTGSGFVPGSTVALNGVTLTPTYVSASQLSVAITAGEGSLPATVTVTNPSGTSNGFEVE